MACRHFWLSPLHYIFNMSDPEEEEEAPQETQENPTASQSIDKYCIPTIEFDKKGKVIYNNNVTLYSSDIATAPAKCGERHYQVLRYYAINKGKQPMAVSVGKNYKTSGVAHYFYIIIIQALWTQKRYVT